MEIKDVKCLTAIDFTLCRIHWLCLWEVVRERSDHYPIEVEVLSFEYETGGLQNGVLGVQIERDLGMLVIKKLEKFILRKMTII